MLTNGEIAVLRDRAHGMSRAQQITMAKEFCDEALMFAIMDRLNDRTRMERAIENVKNTRVEPITTWLGSAPKEDVLRGEEVEKYEII